MNPSLPFGRWIIMPAVTQKSVNVLRYGAPANIFPLVTGCHWLCLSMVHKLEMASSAPTRIEMGPNIVGIGKHTNHTHTHTHTHVVQVTLLPQCNQRTLNFGFYETTILVLFRLVCHDWYVMLSSHPTV